MAGGSDGGLARQIILALVAEMSGTTRELETRFGRRCPWYADRTVKRTLGRLRVSGLVEQHVERRETRRGRREVSLWEATAAGRAESCEWVCSELSFPLYKDELYARMAFCDDADVPRLCQVIRAAQAKCESRLEQLAELGGASGAPVASEAIAFGVESDGLRLEVGWLDGAASRLRAREKDRSSPSTDRPGA